MSAAFETARDFAEHGFPVFPVHTVVEGRCSCGKSECNSPGKHPRTPEGVKNATTDERELLHWDERWPDANWAVACDKVAVIDIDSKHGADPAEFMAEFKPTGPTVRTGLADQMRGMHVYCAGGAPTGKTTVAGVEIRGRGAYVLLPDSRHVSGVTYEWGNGKRPWNGNLEPVPHALAPRRAGKGQAPPVEDGKLVAHGARHEHLKDRAVRLVRAGITGERALAAVLWTLFETECEPDPPPDAGSIEALAAWAASSDIAARERRGAVPGELLGSISDALDLPKSAPLAAVNRHGRADDARIVLVTTLGQRIVFDGVRELFDVPTVIRRVASATDGVARPPRRKAAEHDGVAQMVLKAANLEADADDRLEAANWAVTLLESATIVEVATFTTAEGRWEALSAFHAWTPPYEARTPAERALVIRATDTGILLVRSADMAEHVRGSHGVRLSWEAMHSRLDEVGWRNLGEVQQRQPRGTGKRKVHLYEVPTDAQ